jgi:hypothetical protein
MNTFEQAHEYFFGEYMECLVLCNHFLDTDQIPIIKWQTGGTYELG